MCAVAAILINQCLWCLWHLKALSPLIANVWGIHFQVMPRAQICEKVAAVLPPFQMTMGAVAAILIIQRYGSHTFSAYDM